MGRYLLITMDLGTYLRCGGSQSEHISAQKHAEAMSSLVFFQRNRKYFCWRVSKLFGYLQFLFWHFSSVCPDEFIYIFERNNLNSYKDLNKQQPSYLLKLLRQAKCEPSKSYLKKLNTSVFTVGYLRKKEKCCLIQV